MSSTVLRQTGEAIMQGELNVKNLLTDAHQSNLDNYLTIIYTRFVGPSNTKGSRIVATSTYFGKNSKVEHNYLHEYGGTENHLTAAFKLLMKHRVAADDLQGNFELVGQSDNPTGSGMAFVFKRVGA
jgi:hypothetical protein